MSNVQKLKAGDLVLVTWDDAIQNISETWFTKMQMKRWSRTRNSTILNVGWVVRHGRKFLTLVAKVAPELGDAGLAFKIPVGCIRDIRVLESTS